MSDMIGMQARDLPTPALLVNIAAMERNQQRMVAFCAGAGVALRPHTKSHRSPDLVRLQLAAGASGICCGSLHEAEMMLAAGIDDILITREIVQAAHLERVAELAAHATLTVIVDDEATTERLDRCARAMGTHVGVLVDVDLGLDRSGVQPGEPTRHLAHRVAAAHALRFVGLMGYEGSMHDLDLAAREQACARALARLVATRKQIERDGIAVRVVSSGATSTYRTAGAFAGITEIQPGSYLLGDAKYRRTLPEVETALTVLTTVISRPSVRRVTIDAGQKKTHRQRTSAGAAGRPGKGGGVERRTRIARTGRRWARRARGRHARTAPLARWNDSQPLRSYVWYPR